MKGYKITKERLMAMAEECAQVREALKRGFPEAFEEKEKEWVDVTEELIAKIETCGDGYTVYFYHGDEQVGFADNEGVYKDAQRDYKLEKGGTNFIFFRKQ